MQATPDRRSALEDNHAGGYRPRPGGYLETLAASSGGSGRKEGNSLDAGSSCRCRSRKRHPIRSQN